MTDQPFGRLVGEEAFGNWTLEVWDNRVGAALTNNVLLAWKLNLTYVNTNPPTVTLTNGQQFCSTLVSNETAYFLVNVPISAGAATNIVTASQNVTLRYSAVGLPTGQEPPDTVFFADEPGGTAILDDTGWNSFDSGGQFLGGAFAPQILPGRRYYLAVQNRYPGTNAFCIRVEFDSTSTTLVPITPIGTNDIVNCVSGFIDTNGISYYAFTVRSNAIGAEFSIANIVGGDVSLYVKRNLPVPRTDRYFAKSENPLPGSGEFIQVADFSGLLLPGRWYLAVVPVSGTPSYEICAREIPGPVIPLPVNVLYTNTVPTNSAQYYKVQITSNTLAADFRTLYAGVSNVDLFISTNTMQLLLASPTNAMFASTNPATGNESIGLSVDNTNAMLTPGTWYLAVVNKDIAPVTYTVQVAVMLTNINYIPLISGVPRTGELGPTNRVGYYSFEVSPDAIQAVFETFGTTNDVDLYIRWGFPLPPPATNRFDFASTNTPSGQEWIALIAGDTNRLLRPGSYWIAVVAKDPNVVSSYKVRATQILDSEVTRMFEGFADCSVVSPIDTNALHSGVRFYRFDISSNAVQAKFETYGANGNVDLYLQYGLPITNYSLLLPPSVGSSFTNSENPGLLSESICLLTNSRPIALRAGTWYLAVVNRETNDVSYCLRTSAVDMTLLVDGEAQCRSLEAAAGSATVGIHYFSYNVPTNAVQTIFEAYQLSGNVDLYVTKAPPLTDCNFFTADLANFAASSTNLGLNPETICLSTNSQPLQLSAGQWYVAVVNRETNSFTGYCVRASNLYGTNFTVVTNGLSFCRSVGVTNGAPNSGIDYYTITVTNNPVLATFQTFNADGNVDLYVTRDFCFPNFATFDHTLTNYPYASVNAGITPECITLGTNSSPVVLTNGEWYVAVVNRASTNVNYCFLASQFDTNPIQPLTNNIARCAEVVPPTNSVGAVGVRYYSFNVSTNALQATFEVYNASGNVDLYLQPGFCFQNRDTFSLAQVNAAYASTNSGTNAESICVHGASSPLPLQPGEWHLAVVNRESTDVNFCVRVREQLDTDIIGLTNRVDYTLPLTNLLGSGAADYYRYRISPNAVQVSVQVFQMTENVDLFIDPGFCPENFANPTYSSTNGGLTNELIMVTLDSTPFPLTPGDWLIAVTNRGPSDAGYTIRVTELLASDVIRLTNALPFQKTVAGVGSVNGLPADYYVYNVSSNAVRAQFEILAPSGNVNLIARKGLPLPTLANSSFVSSNSGTSAELIVVFNTSTPVALSPGDWYLAVLNATASDVTYSVVATEYSEAGTNVAIRGITLVSNTLCLTWSGVLTGVNYHVQGKADFGAPAWVPVSPTIRAVSDTITWCITLPSPYHFFRLAEGLSPLSAGNPVTFTSMVFTGGVLTLQWNAPPNLRFVAEFTNTLFPPLWQPYPDYITSTNGVYIFRDDGSRTGGPGVTRYYRFLQVP